MKPVELVNRLLKTSKKKIGKLLIVVTVGNVRQTARLDSMPTKIGWLSETAMFRVSIKSGGST